MDLHPEPFAVVRKDPGAALPAWALSSPFFSLTRTQEELSIVCHAAFVPPFMPAQRSFRCLAVKGPLAFTEVGVLDSLAHPLAQAGLSILALSTHDTDYLLIPDTHLTRALHVLESAGHSIA